MEPKGLDRTAILGILLMSLLLGVWMIYTAPTPEQIAAQEQARAAQAEAAGAGGLDDEIAEDPGAPQPLTAPADSLFAAAERAPERRVVVLTDRVEATFSTRGGSLVSVRLRDFTRAGTDEPVELVADAAGALSVGFAPSRGDYADSRTLAFTPLVGGQPFAGDTLRVEGGPATLAFETPAPAAAGHPAGALRLAYTFEPDSYDIDLRLETPGSGVLAQGYDLAWNGALPLAEADPKGEVMQAGAYVRSGGETDILALSEPGEAEPLVRTGRVDWVAVKTKFFLAALIPAADTEAEGAELTGLQRGAATPEGVADGSFGQDFTARLEMPGLAAGSAHAVTLYIGPLELRRLAQYGLYDTVTFGFGETITRPIARYLIAPAFAFLSTFLPNYGLVIILFALLVKLLLWPLTSASYRSMAKMRELQPEMAALKETYPDDPQKQQEAMMRLYKERGVNPLGGCLPMLLQYPILIALWQFFQSTLVLRSEPFLWAKDLSAPDPVVNLPFTIPFYGDFIAGFTFLMGLSMIATMKLSQPSGSAVTGQQKVLMYMMPAIFFLFFNGFPSGLSLYYLAFNVYSVVQQRMINKQVHEQALKGEIPGVGAAAPKANGRAAKAAKAGAKKSPSRPKGGITSAALAEAARRRRK